MEVYELRPILDDPRYEGFGNGQNNLGNEKHFTSDVFRRERNGREYGPVPKFASIWKPAPVEGRVRSTNDFPCWGLIPVFSLRAVERLRDILEPNGEILPLISESGTYFVFNPTTVIDALDEERSVVSRYSFQGSPIGAISHVDRYEFIPERLKGATIFQIKSLRYGAYVTPAFIKRVRAADLRGFDFMKLWPIPEGESYWRLHKEVKRARAKEKLPKGRTVKGESLWLEMQIEGPEPTEAERQRAEAFADQLDALLVDPHSEAPAVGNLELIDFAAEVEDQSGNVTRFVLSCPDTDELIRKLHPLLTAQHWPRGMRIIKRHGSFDNVEARGEEVNLGSLG